MTSHVVKTRITEMFGIKHPIILAGMNVAAGPELAAAVTNCGGLGVIGGVGYTPEFLREQIKMLKDGLKDKNAPFGVDLLLPKVGGGARATNKDYTKGQLPELIDIIIESGAKLFVSAVGVPPKYAVDKLHAAGIPVSLGGLSVFRGRCAPCVGVPFRRLSLSPPPPPPLPPPHLPLHTPPHKHR